ncbi:hypothetical protein [Salinispora arenicola]|nr:hypothetical protein [Salinispora arenicola]
MTCGIGTARVGLAAAVRLLPLPRQRAGQDAVSSLHAHPLAMLSRLR